MPRRFFRRFSLKRERLVQQWYLAPFKHLLQDPALWGIRRRNVVPAVAMGLFVAWMPFPGHMLVSTLLAIAIRINVPVAVLACLVSNPLTMGPMYYFAFRFGAWLLGTEPRPFQFDLSIAWMRDGLVYVWNPLLLGCVLLGAASAIVAYVTLDLLWRASVAKHKKQRTTR